MGVSTLSAAIRIGLGVSLVLFAGAAGFVQRSPWILPFMGLGFTSAYLFGQLRLWRVARNTGKLKRYWLQLPADFAVQLLLVSALYLIGFGLSALMTGEVEVAAFAPGDAIWPLGAGAAASILGLYIDRIEGHPSSFFPDWMNSPGEDAPDIVVRPEPVTLESFYADFPMIAEPQFSNEPADDPESLKGLPGLTDDDITRLEARLGRALPDRLIALLQKHNGGLVNGLCIVREGVSDPRMYDDILLPFGLGNALIHSDEMRTVWDAVQIYADSSQLRALDARTPEDHARIVISLYGLDMLFLDYNQPGSPRVGLCDFDRFDLNGNREAVTWWADFEAFFAALRHYEPA